jgi:hypothetical protein
MNELDVRKPLVVPFLLSLQSVSTTQEEMLPQLMARLVSRKNDALVGGSDSALYELARRIVARVKKFLKTRCVDVQRVRVSPIICSFPEFSS